VELTLDLRFTPPDKVLPRLFGALERVGDDVTLLVLLRDTPEYAGVVASAYQALRAQGYASDSARVPPGGQRLRVQRRRDQPSLRPSPGDRPPDPVYAPPAGPALAPPGDAQEPDLTATPSQSESPDAEPPEPASGSPLQGQP
jgi:hypothetical protein